LVDRCFDELGQSKLTDDERSAFRLQALSIIQSVAEGKCERERSELLMPECFGDADFLLVAMADIAAQIAWCASGHVADPREYFDQMRLNLLRYGGVHRFDGDGDDE
jgi:hypothetical protein